MENKAIFHRVDQFRYNLGLSQTEFALKCGVTQGFYSDMKSGRTNVSGKLLIGIARAFPRVNFNFFFRDGEEMFISDGETGNTDNTKLFDLVIKINQLPQKRRDVIIKVIEDLLTL